MKYAKYIIGAFLAGLLLSVGISVSATVIQGFQGGIGIGTATPADVGKFPQISSTTPFLTYSFGTSTGGTGTLSGNGTSTQVAFYNGLQTLTSSAGLTFDSATGNFTVSGTSTAGTVKFTGFSNNPQIYFNSLSTGIHSPGPDILMLQTGSVDRIALLATGYVGIGTSTPDEALAVQGIGTKNIFETYTSSSQSVFSITSVGNVGIGTTTPQTSLHVIGSSTVSGNHSVGGTLTIGTLNGVLKGTSGVVSAAVNGTDYSLIATTTCSAGQHLVSVSSTGAFTCSNDTITSINGGSGAYGILPGNNMYIATTTTSTTVIATTTPALSSITFPDSTKTSTGYKDFSVNILNTSSTTAVGASSTIQKMYLTGMTLTLISCSTDGSSITIQSDYRASSTPQTYGTSIFTGLSCTSSGASTTTFSNASIPANSVLNFWPSSVPNSTTTLRIYGRAKET